MPCKAYDDMMTIGIDVYYLRGRGMKKEKSISKNAGFTLVELIIVIAIMTVLASAIGLMVIRYIRKARAANAMEELRTIVSAVETGLISSYAEDHEMKLNKHYTGSDGNTVPCGMLTNYMISRAQNNSVAGVSEDNALDYYFAQKVLEELNAENGSNYRFLNFTGDEDEPLGMNCDSFYSQFGCPGVLVVYGGEGKVLFAQYYNSGCLIQYVAGDGYTHLEDQKTFAGAPKIQ